MLYLRLFLYYNICINKNQGDKCEKMEQIIGYLFANISSIFFSIYVIPKKK